METSSVAVATVTWARSPEEEQALRRSLALLAAADLPLAVADTGTNAAFTAFLRRLPRSSITVPDTKGLVAQVEASFRAAADFDRPFIFYVEPDKAFFFQSRMSDFLRNAPQRHDVGVVIASRSDDSFATFPPMQRYTEGVINHLCGELLGQTGDYSYGPFLMNRALLPCAAHLDGRLGWGWRHSMFVAAHRAGLGVFHVIDDYPCPPEQRSEDDAERRHRMRQLSENLLGLID